MRICKIKDCTTNDSDKNRSLFEVKGEHRLKWIPLIQTYQQLDVTKAVYICDLHFDKSDLSKNGNALRLSKNALPRLRNAGSEQTPEISNVADMAVSNTISDSAMPFQSNNPDNDTNNTISILMEVYRT